MKKSKFSESQIVNILKEAEAGVSLEELIRQHGGFTTARRGAYDLRDGDFARDALRASLGRGDEDKGDAWMD